jgi:hypothetical protein
MPFTEAGVVRVWWVWLRCEQTMTKNSMPPHPNEADY